MNILIKKAQFITVLSLLFEQIFVVNDLKLIRVSVQFVIQLNISFFYGFSFQF